ncbi:MAG: hypothetical protein ACPGR8_06920 [Limisphaerales bacterium]
MRYVGVDGKTSVLVGRYCDSRASDPCANVWHPTARRYQRFALESCSQVPKQAGRFSFPTFLWVSKSTIAWETVAHTWQHIKWRSKGPTGVSPELVVLMTWCWSNHHRANQLKWIGGARWPDPGLLHALELAWGVQVAQLCVQLVKKRSHPKCCDVRNTSPLPSPWLTVKQLKDGAHGRASGLLAWVLSLFELPFPIMLASVLMKKDMQLPPVLPAIHPAVWCDPLALPSPTVATLKTFVSRWEYNGPHYVLVKRRAHAVHNALTSWSRDKRVTWFLEALPRLRAWGRSAAIGPRRPKLSDTLPAIEDSAVIVDAQLQGENFLYAQMAIAGVQLMDSKFVLRIRPVLALDAPCAAPTHTVAALCTRAKSVLAEVTIVATAKAPLPYGIIVTAAESGVRQLNVVVPLFEALGTAGCICDCVRNRVCVDFSLLSPALYSTSSAWAALQLRAERARAGTALQEATPDNYSEAIDRVQSLTVVPIQFTVIRPTFAQMREIAAESKSLYYLP